MAYEWSSELKVFCLITAKVQKDGDQIRHHLSTTLYIFFQQETRPLIEATKRNRSSKEQAPKEEKGKIKIKNRSIKKLQLIQIS